MASTLFILNDARGLRVRRCDGQQQRRVGLEPRGGRQDGVVHVEHRMAHGMLHRWQFVHPLAVIALVVLGHRAAAPAVQGQRGLRFRQVFLVEQQVDVAKRGDLRVAIDVYDGCVAFEEYIIT